ncbi:CPBP family glutamic-type intramembrane protease [Modestobacter sp. I12A-02662]|uniref:CPBP family glutamic-type intramembrane protease n=1 Tax=Modestobacter sp. I12A-02662 TaxID=1730496 RepID=UPI0034DE8AF4
MDRRPLATFWLLAFGLTWAVWVPRALTGGDPGPWGPLSTYGPALGAVLAAVLTGGRPALAALGRRLIRWRVGRWWAVVLLGPAALWLVTVALTVAVGGRPGDATPLAGTTGPAGVLVLLLGLALTDGLGEETGWRGSALPTLLRRTGPVAASLVLGLAWALWHAPLARTDGAVLEGTAIWLLLVQLPALAVLHTWVFLGTGGSALTAVALHATTSLFAVPLPGDGSPWPPYLVQLGVQVAAALAVVAGWRRAPTAAGAGQRHDARDWAV